MAIAPGTYALGPENGELLVHTARIGAAARAGHDLEIVVTSWQGTLEVGEASRITLSADSSSFRVRSGHGGIQALGEDDKDNIRQTIDEEVLRRTAIAFRSTAVETGGNRLHVRGDLELMGRRQPVSFDLELDDGRLTGSATVRQSDFGMKPYTALFGTLKVADEVEVTVAVTLQSR